LTTLFDDGPRGRDSTFELLRTRPDLSPARAFLEQLWTQYEPYADRNFLTEFRNHIFPRYWEMYLACACLEQELQLRPRRNAAGPDVLIDTRSGCVAIEAVAPEGGDDLDWPPLDTTIGFRLPEDEIIRRYTGVIRTKAKKFDVDLLAGRLQPVDLRVIAVNGINVPLSSAFEDVPRILKAVYPIHHCEAVFDPSGQLRVNWQADRHGLQTRAGSPIPTGIFLDREYTEVSAVLFSSVWPPDTRRPLGHDFIVAHNREALRPLPRGFWPYGKEFWYEGDALCGQTWSTRAES